MLVSRKPRFALALTLILTTGLGCSVTATQRGPAPSGPSAPGTPGPSLKDRALQQSRISDDVPDASDVERLVGDWDPGLAHWMPAFRIFVRLSHDGSYDVYVTGVSATLGDFVGDEAFRLTPNGDGSLSAVATLRGAPSNSLSLRFAPTADRDALDYVWRTREGGVDRPVSGRAHRVSAARAAQMRAKSREVRSQERLGDDERDCTSDEAQNATASELALAGRDICLSYLFQAAAPDQLDDLFDDSLAAMRKNADLRVVMMLDEAGLKEDAWAPKRARLLRTLVLGLDTPLASTCSPSRFSDGQTLGKACGVENAQREAVALYLLKDGAPLDAAPDDLVESWLGAVDPELASLLLDRALAGMQDPVRETAISRALGKLIGKDNLWKGIYPSASEKLLDLSAKAPLAAESRAPNGLSLLEAAIRAGDFSFYRAISAGATLALDQQTRIALSEIDAQIARTNTESDPEARNLIRAKLRGLRAIVGGLAERL